MGKQKQTDVVQAAPEIPQMVTNGINNTEERQIMYVVVREGFRVSDREYQTKDDPYAIEEQAFWSHIAKAYSYGERVDIVQYESKKHRIW